MRICDLQVAKNSASFCSQLTQYKNTDHKVSTQSQNTTEQTKSNPSVEELKEFEKKLQENGTNGIST